MGQSDSFFDGAQFQLFGRSGKRHVGKRQGKCYDEACIVPTIKHPEAIHVWGCFSFMGAKSLSILPKNTSMNSTWYQKPLISNHS